MSLNCNEINVILSELNLEGAFIQDIIQPGYDTLAFYTYKEGCAKTVLVCTAQNSVRINETRKKITKNDKPLRFMEFLRSRIKGCRINSCAQIGFERVIKMELSRLVEEKPKAAANGYVHISLVKKPVLSKEELEAEAAAAGQAAETEEKYILYVKLWNNAANVILCDTDSVILEPMFRRPERGEVKGERFTVEKRELDSAEMEVRFPVREWGDLKDDGGVGGGGAPPAEGVASNDGRARERLLPPLILLHHLTLISTGGILNIRTVFRGRLCWKRRKNGTIRRVPKKKVPCTIWKQNRKPLKMRGSSSIRGI